MKRIFKIIVVAVMCCVFVGCGQKEASKTSVERDSINKEAVNGESQNDVSAEEEVVKEKPTIDSQVVYDQNGLKITAEELVFEEDQNVGVKFYFENSTGQNYSIRQLDFIVDGYYVKMPSYSDAYKVSAGESFKACFYFSPLNLDEIAEIQVAFDVYDLDTGNYFITEYATVQTSQYGKIEPSPLSDGVEIYNENNLYIACKYEKGIGEEAPQIKYVYKNSAETDVGIYVNLYINGQEYPASIGVDIEPLSGWATATTLKLDRLDDIGIESFDSIEEIQMEFSIDSEEFEDEVQTERYNLPLE